jgi:hypothetical protein
MAVNLIIKPLARSSGAMSLSRTVRRAAHACTQGFVALDDRGGLAELGAHRLRVAERS